MKVSIFRVKKTKDYTIMANNHLKNRSLSLKAKGLLSVILSLPDNWDYSINGLVAISKESKDGINATLQELEKNNYLVRSQIRDENGHFQVLYNVYEIPQTEKQKKQLKKYIEKLEKNINKKKVKSVKKILKNSGFLENNENENTTPIRKSRSGKAVAVKPIRKSRSGKTDTVKPTQSNTNNQLLNNKKLKENTNNHILSREDGNKSTADFINFYNKTNISSILEEIGSSALLKVASDVMKIIKDIYTSNKEYEIISGNKIKINEFKNILNNYTKETLKYVLESLQKNDTNVRNKKKYIMASLYNAPKTINFNNSSKIKYEGKLAMQEIQEIKKEQEEKKYFDDFVAVANFK